MERGKRGRAVLYDSTRPDRIKRTLGRSARPDMIADVKSWVERLRVALHHWRARGWRWWDRGIDARQAMLQLQASDDPEDQEEAQLIASVLNYLREREGDQP